MNNKKVDGTNNVTFDNTQFVLQKFVHVGFSPLMVVIQSKDPLITFGFESFTETGFICNTYCISGVYSGTVEFVYEVTRP